MDPSPIPFPTLPQQTDEVQNGDARPRMSSRVHSTPSLPNLWLPSHNNPIPSHLSNRLQARYRPHLRPLDLAASPTATPIKLGPNSPTATRGNNHGSPYRSSTLLTPPLTPSSSFNSNTNEAPSTPPEQNSPLRWLSATDRTYGSAVNGSDVQYSPTNLKSSAPLPRGGYLTPSSMRSHSMSSDAESGYTPPIDMVSLLAANINGLDLTPRDERQMSMDAQFLNSEFDKLNDTTSSRFLLVHNIPPSVSSATLRTAFASMGDIKGILVRFQASHGVIILAFFDVRHASRAQKQICGQTLAGLGHTPLETSFITSEQLRVIIGKSTFVTETDGSFFVSVEDRVIEPANLRSILTSFGELKSFEAAGADAHDQTYHVEYYDTREAYSAFKALNNRTILGVRLRLFVRQDSEPQNATEAYSPDDPFQVASGDRTGSSRTTVVPMDNATRLHEGRVRPRSVSASETMGAPDAVRRLRGRESPLEHSRRSSNDLFFDAVGKVAIVPQTPSRPRSISIGPDDLTTTRIQRSFSGYEPASPTYLYSEQYSQACPEPSSPGYNAHAYSYPQQGIYLSDSGMYGDLEGDGTANNLWAFATPPASAIEYYIPPSPRGAVSQHSQMFPVTPRKPLHSARQRHNHGSAVPHGNANDMASYVSMPSARPSHQYTTHRSSAVDVEIEGEGYLPDNGGHQLNGEKNQLNLGLIEDGVDMRTTVMIKNIPNKMSDKDLMAFINKVCPRQIDFLYLRMDFGNGCNVGYAFVNFITVGDLLHFAKTQLGVKWNMYSSEKVLQMCYATYQGKEALVEKFKNSCIMDEREAWRPKIFYSDGPDQGLPEPFPPPTHLRRKERSSHNRGALFVPSTQYQSHRRDGGHTGVPPLYHHRAHPPRLSTR
ncbi:RNA recognition motif 2-domain-containing protein [Amylocystis lapponica]|nr:RNA recognition motif 2-domain-containing protein [Amylocystis lapponica]